MQGDERMLQEISIIRRCRRTLARCGMKLHKDGSYFWIEDQLNGSKPDKDDPDRWFNLDKLIDHCEKLNGK